MVNRDHLLEAIGGIRDEFIDAAADLLGYTKEDETMPVKKGRVRSIGRTALIAAVVTALLATAALAAFFTISHRVPAAEETFPFKWDDSETGYLEWKDAKLVVTFPETAESRDIEFRPGWLPFDLASEMPGCMPWSGLTKDTWFSRFAAESLAWKDGENFVEDFSGISQPLLIEAHPMSRFNNGGGMLMLYQTPGEITEEHWDDLNADALIFTATQHFDAVPQFDVPERTLTYNYVLLANAEEGWVVTVCGEMDMDTIIKAAKNLEIRPTGKTYTYEDFDNHFLFFDGGVG